MPSNKYISICIYMRMNDGFDDVYPCMLDGLSLHCLMVLMMYIHALLDGFDDGYPCIA